MVETDVVVKREPVRASVPKPTTKARWVTGAVLLAAAGIGAVWAASGASDGSGSGSAQTFTVQRGQLTISVTESGTIKAREQEVIKNEVEGQTQILYIIPEGTIVKEGDLLVELDSSRLQDQKVDQQIKVQNGEAAFIRARENLEVVKNQTKSDVSKAGLEYQFATEDLQNYVEGQFKKDLKEAENKIRIAGEELARAKDRYAASQKLFEQQFQSLTELKADELALQKAVVQEELARDDLQLLKDFTYKRKHAELAANVEQTQAALERAQRKASADVVQAEAELRAKDSEYQRQKQQLEKVLRLIDKTRIEAPTAGLAVYATTAQGGWRGNNEPLAEGQTVRERQDLIYLPTTSSRMAEIKIHESSLDKVKVGMPVRVTVDAQAGQSYTGRVAKIAPLPDAQSSFMNPDLKVYNTQIYLDGDASNLKTGMSCRAEIIVDQYADAVYVPVQAVVRVAGKPTVFVADGKGPAQPRPIELGLDNNINARVLGGLTPGEQVLRAPPLAEATSTEEGGLVSSTQPVLVAAQLSATQPAGAVPGPAAAVPAVAQAPLSSTQPLAVEAGAAATQPAAATAEEEPEWLRNMPAERREQMRRRMESMTPEQREQMRQRQEEMRKRMESMTPEEREQMRQQWQQRGGGGPGGPGGGGGRRRGGEGGEGGGGWGGGGQ